jgi:hypothetical protein
MSFLKMSLVFFSSGIAFFFDLNVVFERFINVLNIKNIQMIDVNTKLNKKSD